MSSAAVPPPGAEPRPGADPPPLLKPQRAALSVRDMVMAVGVLVLVALVIAGVGGACSFAPSGPTIDPTGLPVVDAPAQLRALAPDVPFAVRIPAVPAGWTSNSVAQDRVGDTGSRAVRTGYITPQGRYLRFLQSDATEEALVAVEAGARPIAAQGTEDVGGQRWVVYGTAPDEPIWIAEVGGVRLLITGSGSVDDYSTLAGAVQAGELLR